MAIRLHMMLTGTMRQAACFDARPAPGARITDDGWPFTDGNYVRVPIPAFLVEHPDAGAILIDTGLHSSVAADPRRNLGRVNTLFMDPRMEAGQSASEQLRRRGIDPAAVEQVVLTHLHVDHASAIEEFAGATFVVDPVEWAGARAARSHPSYHCPQVDLPLDWDFVDFAGTDAHAREGFDRVVDLLGDGSLLAISTPGHSAGHLSVLVRLRSRDVLIAGDAAFTQRALDHGTIPMYLQDEARFRDSLAALRRWVASHPAALVIPGHDAARWRRLEPVYE